MLISISELLKQSYQLYKSNFVLFLKYIVINAVVPLLIGLLASGGAILAPMLLISSNMVISIIAALVVVAVAVGAAYVTTWFSFVLIKVINNRQLGLTDAGFVTNMKSVQPLVWRGFGASVLASLISGAPLVIALLGIAITTFVASLSGGAASTLLKLFFSLVAIYGLFHLVYFGIKLQFSMYGVLFENKKAIESLKYSAGLVKGRWWPIFGRMFVCGLALWLIIAIVNGILGFIGAIGGISIIKTIFSVITSVFSVLVWQMIVMVLIILYNDVKKLSTGDQTPTLPEIK